MKQGITFLQRGIIKMLFVVLSISMVLQSGCVLQDTYDQCEMENKVLQEENDRLEIEYARVQSTLTSENTRLANRVANLESELRIYTSEPKGLHNVKIYAPEGVGITDISWESYDSDRQYYAEYMSVYNKNIKPIAGVFVEWRVSTADGKPIDSGFFCAPVMGGELSNGRAVKMYVSNFNWFDKEHSECSSHSNYRMVKTVDQVLHMRIKALYD